MRPAQFFRRSSRGAASPAVDGVAEPREAPKGYFGRTFSSLSIPAYRNLWFGVLFSTAAMQINIVARGWLSYELTGSAAAIGLVALARGLPQIVISPIAGVMADHFPRRRILIIIQSVLCVLALTAAVLVETDTINIWHLTAISFAQGIVFSFNQPARQALLADIVGPDHLQNALAVNSTAVNINRVLAPSLAGVLIAWHPSVSFDVIALLYVGAFVSLVGLPAGRVAASAVKWDSVGGAFRGMREEMFEGFRYIGRSPTLLALLGMAFIPILLGQPYLQLLPVFQKDVLNVGEVGLGVMYTLSGIGALAGSLSIAYLSSYPKKRELQTIAGLAFGITLLLFALSGNFWLSLVFLLFLGMASQSYLTINSVLLMTNTDRAYYGRVMSVYMLSFAIMPIGVLPIGILIDTIGPQVTIAIVGALLATFILAVAIFFPSYRRMESSSRPALVKE